MKTYFISFSIVSLTGEQGFGNCVKENLPMIGSRFDIRAHEDNIKKDLNAQSIVILHFIPLN